jgi:hypothetical protein
MTPIDVVRIKLRARPWNVSGAKDLNAQEFDMPRFFFHLREAENWISDDEGQVLDGTEAALESAQLSGREILAEKVRAGDAIDNEQIEIVDEDGEKIAVVKLKDLLRLQKD